MTDTTKTIITAAIKADPSMTTSAKSRLVRILTRPQPDYPVEARLFTERQAATILGFTTRTIRNMKRNGIIRVHKILGKNKIVAESVYELLPKI